jgi:hypothetical protein
VLWIETGLVLFSLLIALIYPQLGSCWFEKLEKHFSQLSQKRTVSVVLVGITALVLRAALLPIEPIPEPIVHDEFGYLLAADTFAHGRLTNPSHPMWVHFETFSILQKPTYQCFAQPAQGMILALGRVLFGHPFWGVWLSIGVMCAAITWMLQGWLPPEWALLGGVLAVMRYGTFGYWANSYWGGAAGAIGGALVLGALPRIKSSQRLRDALLMGLGLAILANSRPYEGFVFSVPIAVLLFVWMMGKNRPQFQVCLRRVVLPLALILIVAGAGMAYYFWRVTGDPLRMPYQIVRDTYLVAPYMIWQPVRPEPVYPHQILREMYTGEALANYYISRSLTGVLLKIYTFWRFYFAAALVLPLAMLPLVLPPNLSWRSIKPRTLSLFFVFGAVALGVAVSTFYNPHYSAPATGLFLALVLIALHQVRNWNRAGLFVARACVVTCVMTFMLRVGAEYLRIPITRSAFAAWYQQGLEPFGRTRIKHELELLPGKHLVLVCYEPEHEAFKEWVYNDANIDDAKIVWARDMNTEENQELVNYFKDRQVWRLDADARPPQLSLWQVQTRHTADGEQEQGEQ